MAVVDLRSDTVTRPTRAMRDAMANAEVGDDVFGDDPTVRRLEERVADLVGKEAALYVPSGTMANQVALRSHTRPGDEVIIGRDTHCWRHESGALAALAGVQVHMLTEPRFTAADVRAAFKPSTDPYVAPTRVVVVENTHGKSGGAVWKRDKLAEVVEVTHELGMAAHLDGARLWNAAVASNATEKELAAEFDSVCVCLSKGLGAPVGSLIAGTRDFIRTCHRFRKMYGGGMRQVGILAAAGLHALDHHRARVADDHANARAFAEVLASAPNVKLDLASVETNLVMFDLARGTSAALIAAAKDRGIYIGADGPTRVRAVTHLDVDRDAVMKAATTLAELAATLG